MSAINFLIIPAAWLTAAAAAVAAPVLGNLSVPSVDRVVPVTYNEWQASSFTLSDTAGPWRVRSVRLRLAQDVPNTSFTLRITGQSAQRPAWNDVRVAFRTPALIAAATGPSAGAPAGTVEFMVQNSPDPVLLPGETYWLVAGVTRQEPEFDPSGGRYYWSYAAGSNADAGSAAGWQFGLLSASAGTLGANWAPEPATPFIFSVDAVQEIPPVTLAAWRASHPGGPVEAAAFLASDTDGDGLNGLMEFAFNRMPSIPDAPAGFVVPLYRDPEDAGCEYTRWSNAPELRYECEVSADLTAWAVPSPAGVTQSIEALPGGMERVKIRLLQPGSRRFIRVRISRL